MKAAVLIAAVIAFCTEQSTQCDFFGGIYKQVLKPQREYVLTLEAHMHTH